MYSIIGLSLLVSLTSVAIASGISIPLGIVTGLHDFRGKKLFTRVTYAFMGIPPVVLGLVVFLFLARKGPLGYLNIKFTVTAMIIAQTLLVIPIILGNIFNSVTAHGRVIMLSCKTLGASRMQTLWILIKELKRSMLIAVITGFGRAISEVGAVFIVGGNIKDETRTMTTYIVMQNSMGNYEVSIALGIVLLTIVFIVNGILHKYVGVYDD
ncbi:ABC transporter permease [Acidaminobacter sp. JC074]|uniref:ABC transporter permease n=1 Tax=Acidaminobacter sp. JC074 TaxID=2530199 RepID=UPI001F0D9FE7|nr:ABC transporter permease [Acidaminobacter sp. JC074]